MVGKAKGAFRLTCLDALAERLGLASDMALADARAMIPRLDVVEEDLAADAALLGAIADWCDRYTPLVALDETDGLLLDISGCAHLFGGEAVLGRDCLTRLKRQGFTVRAAIAGTPRAARAVARYGSGGIIEPGGEGAALLPLPAAALGLDGARQHGLARMGLIYIADIETRPRAPLAARFGSDLLDRLDQAFGRLPEAVTPRRPLPDCMAERRFAEPLAHEAGIRLALAGLEQSLSEMLEARGEGAKLFEASFFRSDGAVRRLGIETGLPLRDAKVIDRLFALKLEALADPLDPGFGFDLIRLSAGATERLAVDQAALATGYDDDVPDEAAAERALAEVADALSARLGPQRVRRFLAQDTHDPVRAALAVPALHYNETARLGAPPPWPEPGAVPERPLRLLARPEPIEVLAEIPDGPPTRFRWRRAVHDVAKAEGPERIAAEWWLATESLAPTRDYYRIEQPDGRRFWLYRDGLYGPGVKHPPWFMHGLFA
ncbi:DNA polymerase Y family protein [Bosea caraganae]|uniref:DNA polymerase Y family protein n=1 Tax=Bosea caraganae TaxID=2763117 RepID=UPI001FEC5978|nr:DNA polymerase Y family protein [Bosea caraganae]